jgi:hypothetical protein
MKDVKRMKRMKGCPHRLTRLTWRPGFAGLRWVGVRDEQDLFGQFRTVLSSRAPTHRQPPQAAARSATFMRFSPFTPFMFPSAVSFAAC